MTMLLKIVPRYSQPQKSQGTTQIIQLRLLLLVPHLGKSSTLLLLWHFYPAVPSRAVCMAFLHFSNFTTVLWGRLSWERVTGPKSLISFLVKWRFEPKAPHVLALWANSFYNIGFCILLIKITPLLLREYCIMLQNPVWRWMESLPVPGCLLPPPPSLPPSGSCFPIMSMLWF